MGVGLGSGGWSGDVRMGMGWGLFVGAAGENRPHAHHAVQVVLSKAPQRIWQEATGWRTCHGAIVGADVPHQLEQSRTPVTLLYLEPDSLEGRRAVSHAPPDGILPETLASAASEPDIDDPDLVSRTLDALFPSATALRALQRDAVMEAAIARLPPTLPDRFGINELAEQTRLSPSRVQHRFRAHTGLAVRPYLRWRRLLTAIDLISSGAALTDSAITAGFADAAHFTRTFRRHFGITPSAVLGLNRTRPGTT